MYLTLVTTEESARIATPVINGLTAAAESYFVRRPVRKLRVGCNPIPRQVVITAAVATRYSLRDWFGDGRDLSEAEAELSMVNPRVNFEELKAWKVFATVFPRELSLDELMVLSQVAAVVNGHLLSDPVLAETDGRREQCRDNPEQLLRRRRPRRRSTG
jgi:hypothetical protein